MTYADDSCVRGIEVKRLTDNKGIIVLGADDAVLKGDRITLAGHLTAARALALSRKQRRCNEVGEGDQHLTPDIVTAERIATATFQERAYAYRRRLHAADKPSLVAQLLIYRCAFYPSPAMYRDYFDWANIENRRGDTHRSSSALPISRTYLIRRKKIISGG